MSASETPKYLDLSRKIEGEIASGRLKEGRLPGLREIASAYAVSVLTASRALQLLREKGLVRSVHRSGNFVIGARGAAEAATRRPSRRWGLSFRTTPGPWQRAADSVVLSGFDAIVSAEGMTFVPDVFPAGNDAPARELGRLAREAAGSGIGGIFLLPSRIDEAGMRQDERILDACDAAGLPVVLIERNLRGDGRPLARDLVATDDLDGGLRCTQHLLRTGRRRVAFVSGSPTSSHDDRLAGYLLALFKAGEPGASREPAVIEFRRDLPSKEAYGLLADALLAVGADGVVCYQDTVAIGLVVELLARRAKLPDDLAIVGFDDLPLGSSFSIGLTTYALDSARIAREAVRLMERRLSGDPAPPIKVSVPGRLIPRESAPELRGRRPSRRKKA